MSVLKLYIPERVINDGLSPDDVPENLKEEIKNADALFNNSILLADLWDIEHTDALHSINEVNRFTDGKSALFVKEDFEDIIPVLEDVSEKIGKHLDSEGRIREADIFDRKYFELDEYKRVFFKNHKIVVLYFLQDIKRIIDLFRYALKNGVSADYIPWENIGNIKSYR